MRVFFTSIFLYCTTLFLFAQPSTFRSSGIAGGSALFRPSFSPYNADKIYMASDLTALFVTENGGANWEVVPWYKLRATTESEVFFTSHPDTLYTIYNDFIPDKKYVVMSTDGGENWEPLPTDPTNGASIYLYVDPNRTDRLVVVNEQSIFYTNNCGQSFEKVYQTNPNKDLYMSGAIWDGENITLGTGDGLLTSFDNGQNFAIRTIENISNAQGILSLSSTKINNQQRIICTVRNQNEMWSGMQPDGGDYYGYQQLFQIEKTTYGGLFGKNVSQIVQPDFDFPFYVKSTETSEEVVYSAGANVNNTGVHIHPQVYRSKDAGNTWEKALKTDNNINISTGYMGQGGDLEWFWSENAMGFGVNPNNPNTAIITDFTFAHITRNGGETWEALYVLPEERNAMGTNTPKRKAYRSNGLENTSCWWLTWNSPDDMFAAYTDMTAARSLDKGRSWSFDYDGLIDLDGNKYNTIYHIAQTTDNRLYAAASSIHDIYQSTYLTDAQLDNGAGALFTSINGGQSWNLVHDFGMPVIWTSIDPNNPEVAYVSAIHSQRGGIFKTENLSAGSSSVWQKLTNPPRTEGHPYSIHALGNDELVCSFSGRRTGNGTTDFFTQSSGVFYSNNGGQTWEDRSSPEMIYWTKDVVIDPYDASKSTWYAGVFDGFGSHPPSVGLGGLFRTKDKGQTWEELGDFYRVESVTIHPNDANIMYVTTESEGLNYSDNLNTTSPSFEMLEAYPFQQPTRVFFNPYDDEEVWITSFGNGLRVGKDSLISSTKVVNNFSQKIEIYPNPTTNYLTIRLEKFEKATNFHLYNSIGQLIKTVPLTSENNLIHLSDVPTGIYWVALNQISGVVYGQKLVIR